MEKFNGYKFNGKCNLQDPQRIFWLIQNWDFVEKDGSSICEQVFFGREIVTTNRGEIYF